MINTKKIKLSRIKALMLCCQALLLVFTVQWLVSQYQEQHEQLRKNLTKLFTDVQHKISDSLLLTQVIDPASAHKPLTIGSSDGSRVTLSAQGLHRVLAGVSDISADEEKRLFSMDTIRFNELFSSEMKQNGWNFNSEWIFDADSNKKAQQAIFIRSPFFTDQNGIVVYNYRWYLLGKLLPQLIFVLILLSLTALAFWTAFNSLSAQIKLGKLKDDFISNMSHELKTPIATVKVALEALGSFGLIDDPQRSREYLGMAGAEMDRLELMATRVLNTSLLESGRIYLQQEVYSLKQLVNDVLQSMQLRLQQYNASITFRADGDRFSMPMDRLHMQGVLVNLIDNSIKYSTSPVHINIVLTETNGAVRLSVSDDGPGIPEEYTEKVFEKFFRVPTGNRHNARGYGLGLSYAAQVVRQHKGIINVSNLTGGGCVFTMVF